MCSATERRLGRISIPFNKDRGITFERGFHCSFVVGTQLLCACKTGNLPAGNYYFDTFKKLFS